MSNAAPRSLLRTVIIEAARLNMPPRVIATDLGKPAHKVRRILSEERARGIDLPKFKGTGRPRKNDTATMKKGK